MTYKVRSEPGSEYLRQLGSVSDYRTDRNKANARLEKRSSYVIVIPAPPGSQVAIYETDEDEGRQIVWRTICAVILSDHLDNAGQLTNAVTTAGPMVEIGPGSGWVHWGDTTP